MADSLSGELLATSLDGLEIEGEDRFIVDFKKIF